MCFVLFLCGFFPQNTNLTHVFLSERDYPFLTITKKKHTQIFQSNNWRQNTIKIIVIYFPQYTAENWREYGPSLFAVEVKTKGAFTLRSSAEVPKGEWKRARWWSSKLMQELRCYFIFLNISRFGYFNFRHKFLIPYGISAILSNFMQISNICEKYWRIKKSFTVRVFPIS